MLRNAIFAVLLVILAASTTLAGEAPGVTVSVQQTGVGPEGKGLVSTAHGLMYTADSIFMQTFNTAVYTADQSWVAMWSGEVGNNNPYSVGMYYPYSGMKAYQFMVWNGSQKDSYLADVTVSINDPLREKTWNVLWQDEWGVYQERYMSHGDMWTFQMQVPKLSGPTDWDLGGLIEVSGMTPFQQPVPEPAGLAAMLAGVVGLAGGMIKRRRP